MKKIVLIIFILLQSPQVLFSEIKLKVVSGLKSPWSVSFINHEKVIVKKNQVI